MATDDRLLTVLRSLNEMGLCTVQDVHHATGISRQAIYRIVDCLCRHGYARRIPQDSRIVLTAAVRALSAGYRDDAVIVELGAPILEALQREVCWPTSLATLDKDRMIVRATTRYRSPFVFDQGRVGLRLPVLHTSLGLAYLAFSSRQTRDIVLSLLQRSRDRWDSLARDAKATDQVLRKTRQRSYAMRERGMEDKTNSIAVPILCDHEAVASVCITYAAAALTPRRAAAELLRPLREAAGKIAALAVLETRGGEMHRDVAS